MKALVYIMFKKKSILKKVLLIVLFFAVTLNALPTKIQEEDRNKLDALDYLHQYGYLESGQGAGHLIDQNFISTAIKRMQRFGGLSETGTLDAETKALMNTSRCGVSDFQSSRTRRYSIHHWKWPKRILTWRIHNYGNDGIPKSIVRRTFQKSLAKWANVTNLHFRQIFSGKPDIWFKFALGNHGDTSPFKRPWDGVIAHAYYPKHTTPGLAGDVHFNDDKFFTVNSFKGKNLPWVALHEIGHSLGMEHSSIKGSIMYPYYQSYSGKESELTEDDIKGIQALYGTKTKPKPTSKIPVAEKCLHKISASFLAADKRVYIFSGRKMFILKKNLGIQSGPISIWKVFKGLLSVDAAFRRHDGNTVLFRKDQYYVFSPQNKYLSGPHATKSSFAGLEKVSGGIDAAFIWPRTNALYITKGDKYWRYFPIWKGKGYGLVPGYPKSIRNSWRRVPTKIDAAVTWIDGTTYLFKGEKYYKLTRHFKVRHGYPKQISSFWAKSLNCQSGSHDLKEESNAAVKSSRQLTTLLSLVILAIFNLI